MLGILILVTDSKIKNKRDENYSKCIGIINKAPMAMSADYKWSRYPIVFYEVDGKTYKIKSKVGYGGIISFFLKGKKITVYYDKNDPKIAYTRDYIMVIVGIMFLLTGIVFLLKLLIDLI